MSKPIVVTDEILQEWMEAFEKQARSVRMSEGKFTYVQNIEWDADDKVHIIFTPSAYVKMLTLLNGFSDEVAWHGIVDRRGENAFIISDILVYPQEVTGSTVNTDQEEYTKWLSAIPMDTFNRMHMQGHSHVNMAVSPSAVDLNHQDAIVSQLSGDHFYIFMIWNKRLEHNIKVFDFRDNTLYEDKDCIVSVGARDFSSVKFLADAKDQVKRKTPATPVGGYAGGGYGYGGREWERGQHYGGGTFPRGSQADAIAASKAEDKKPKEKKAGKKKEAKEQIKKAEMDKEAAEQKKIILPESASAGKVLERVTDYDSFIFGGMKR